jgi:hypothetical protein
MDQWDAASKSIKNVIPQFTGLDLVAGTELRPTAD